MPIKVTNLFKVETNKNNQMKYSLAKFYDNNSLTNGKDRMPTEYRMLKRRYTDQSNYIDAISETGAIEHKIADIRLASNFSCPQSKHQHRKGR